jgi:hypothetical protein
MASVPPTTVFSYTTTVPFGTVVANSTGTFDMSTTSINCYYSPSVVIIPISDLTAFLTASTTSSSTIGTTLRNNITIANLISNINTKSELDKRWTTGDTISNSYWDTFNEKAGGIDYDFITNAPAIGNELQFVFRFDATVTGDFANNITPSSIVGSTSRFLVGQTFRFGSS